MATDMHQKLISLPTVPKKNLNGKLLRRPRARKKTSEQDDQTQSANNVAEIDHLVSPMRGLGGGFSPVHSIGAPRSPPPSEVSYQVRRDFQSTAETQRNIPYISRDDKRYVIDDRLLYQPLQPHVHPQQNGGHSLLKSYKPRGPDGLTSTHSPKKHQDLTPDMFEDDHLRYYTAPEFSLKHFIIRLSETENLDIDRVQSIVYSKHNYNKITKLIAEQCLHQQDPTVKINTIDATKVDINPVINRVPQKQLLIEMAALVKQQMRDIMNTNVKAVIRSLPKYTPGYPLGAAPHTEIVLYEEDSKESLYGESASQKTKYVNVPRGVSQKDRGFNGLDDNVFGHKVGMTPRSVPPPSESTGGRRSDDPFGPKKFETSLSMFQSSGSKQFQGTGRSFSPFTNQKDGLEPQPTCDDPSNIASHEMAVLDSIICGGLALSLKAHFIDLLPDVSPLMHTLVYINLNFNCFTTIPDEILSMPQLRVLKLRNNPIREIPPEIVHLQDLRTLCISFCLVSYLPKELFQMKHLRYLDVSYNKLTFLPNEVKFLKNLRELSIEGNQIPAMPAGALKLNLTILRKDNTFMHPLFWKDYTNNDNPQRLTNLAALEFAQSRLNERYRDIPELAAEVLKFQEVCDCCQGPLFGPGLRIIRPCSSIFGVKNLPFMFRSCSRYCMIVFLGSVDTLSDIVFDDDDVET